MCLLELARSGSEHATTLFAGGTGRSKAQHLLDVLADGHGAQDVQEDERALGVVVSGQVTVAQSLDPGDRSEGETGHDTTIEDAERGMG